MAKGKVKVSITADADGVKRGTRDAERSLDRLDKKGSRSLGGLKTAGVAAGAAVGAGLVTGLAAATSAAIEAEKSQARLEAQLKAMNTSYGAHAQEIDKVISKTSQLAALDDEDLQDAFTNIVRSTKDVDQGLRLVGLAADLARAKQLDVAKAGEIVGKVSAGNTGVLSRYGIVLKEGATAQQALAELQRRFSGQAAAYGNTTGGAIDRAKVAFENLGEAIGARVAPAVARGANALSSFLNQMGSGQGIGARFSSALRSAAQTTTNAWNGVKAFFGDIFGRVQGDMGRFRQSVQSLAGPIRQTVNGIVAAFRNAFGGGDSGGGIGASLRSIISKLIKFGVAVNTYIVIPIVKRVLPGVRNAFEGLAQIIAGALKVIDGILSGDFGRMWDGVKSIFRGGIKSIQGTLRIATAPLREAASKIGEAVRKPLQTAWDKTVTAAVGFVNAILSVIDRIPGVNVGRVNLPAGVEGRNNDTGYYRSDGKFSQKRALGGKVTAPTVIMGEEAPRHPEWVIATNPAYRQRNVGLWMQAGRDLGMFQGGPLDTALDPGRAALSVTPAAPLVNAGYETARAAIGALPGNPFRGAYNGIGGFALNKAKNYIQSKFTGALGALGGRGASGVSSFDRVARRYGLTMTSGYRPGDDGWHGRNRARDYSNGFETPEMLSFAKFMARTYGSRLLELIYTPLGWGIKNGKRVGLGFWSPAVNADHKDHVHVAFRQGGVRGGKYLSTSYGPPWNAMNGSGVTATGVNLKNAPKRYGIAVDPSMIPLGSQVKVTPNPFGYSGAFTAFDTGGAIKGNRIDFYDWRGRPSQMNWGRRTVTVTPAGGTTTSTSGGGRAGGGGGRPAMRQGGMVSSPGGRPAVSKLISGVTAGGLTGLNEVPEGFDQISRMPTPQEIEDAKLAANLGLAGVTAGKGDDLAATLALREAVQRKLNDAVARGDSAAITELSNELKGLNDSVGDLTQAVRYEGAQETAKVLSAELVKAQVTTPDDLSDDIGVLNQQLANATNAYNTAVANNDTDAIIQWGGEIINLRGQITQLTETMTQTNTLLQQQLDLSKQIAADAQKTAAAASAQTDALKVWLLDFVSSGLGARVGYGLGTPSYAGGLART